MTEIFLQVDKNCDTFSTNLRQVCGDFLLSTGVRLSILLSRIKALFRRIDIDSASSTEEIVMFGDLTYSDGEHAVLVGQENLGLTETELRVLRVLMEHAGKAVSRETLLDMVWGVSAEIETRVTDETVRRIRKKLVGQASCVALSTVWGYGYKLEVLS